MVLLWILCVCPSVSDPDPSSAGCVVQSLSPSLGGPAPCSSPAQGSWLPGWHCLLPACLPSLAPHFLRVPSVEWRFPENFFCSSHSSILTTKALGQNWNGLPPKFICRERAGLFLPTLAASLPASDPRPPPSAPPPLDLYGPQK